MCVSGVCVCERVWAGKLVQGTKLRAFFVPALPLVNLSQALQGSSGRGRGAEGELVCDRERGRGKEGERDSRHRRRDKIETQGETITEQEYFDTREGPIQN